MTPEKPQAQASSSVNDADVDVALLEDAVVGEQALEVVETFRNGSQNA
jgi:coenzyme F420-reducing hydrogenase gamma subunit